MEYRIYLQPEKQLHQQYYRGEEANNNEKANPSFSSSSYLRSKLVQHNIMYKRIQLLDCVAPTLH